MHLIQPSLLLDLDGVVARFHPTLAEVYNSRYPDEEPVTVEDFDGDLESLPSKLRDRLIHLFNEPGFFTNLEPFDGAIATVSQFNDLGYDTSICTAPARWPCGKINGLSAAEKFDWVQRLLPFWSNEVTVTKLKHKVNADMLIDDFPTNIINWCEHHPEGVGYLVDQPWNQSLRVLPNNAVRGDLNGVIKFIHKFWCYHRGKFVYRLDELRD